MMSNEYRNVRRAQFERAQQVADEQDHFIAQCIASRKLARKRAAVRAAQPPKRCLHEAAHKLNR